MSAIGMIRVRHGMTIVVMIYRHAGITKLAVEVTERKAMRSGADTEEKPILPVPAK